jgi:WD40 repeat protein
MYFKSHLQYYQLVSFVVLLSLVDVFQIEDSVTSIEFSPTGEFLATTLSQELGILLWINKSMYQHVSLTPLAEDYDPTEIAGTLRDNQISERLKTRDLNLKDFLFLPYSLCG